MFNFDENGFSVNKLFGTKKSMDSVMSNYDMGDIRAAVDLFNESRLGADAFSEQLGLTDKKLVEYLHTVEAGNATEAGFTKYVQQSSFALNTQTLAMKAGKIAAMALNVALNALFAIGVSLIVNFAAQWWYNIKHAKEQLTEAANTAKSDISKIQESFEQLNQTVEESGKKYAELAQGVDQMTGKNISLSTSDYKDFLSLSNQLAELFPQLTKGYDENGNAILDLSGDVNTIVGSLTDLVNVQRDLAKNEVKDKLPKIFEEADDNLETYKKQKESLEKQRDYLKNYANATASDLQKSLSPYAGFDVSNLDSDQILDFSKRLSAVFDSMKLGYSTSIDGNFLDIVGLDKEDVTGQMDQIKAALDTVLGNINGEIKTNISSTKGELSGLKKYVFYLLDDMPDYFNQSSDQVKLAIQQLLSSSSDWITKMKDDMKGDFSGDNISNWLEANILQGINNMGEDQKADLSQLFSADVSDDTKLEIANNLQKYFDANGIDIKLNFITDPDTNGSVAQINKTFQSTNDALVKGSQGQLAENKKKLEEFFKKNDISTAEEKDAWDAAVKNCKSVDDAIQAYLETKNATNSDAAKAGSTSTIDTANNDAIDDFQSKMQTIKGALSSGNIDASSMIDLKQTLPNVDWESYTSGAKSLDEVLRTFAQSTLQELIEKCPQFATELNQLFNDVFGNATDKTQSLINTLDGLKQNLSVAQTAYTEFADKDFKALQPDTMSSLETSFGNLDGWKDFYDVITSGSASVSQQQQALSDLVSEAIDTSDLIANLTEENADYAAKVLEANGVTNAQTVIQEKLKEKLKDATAALADLKKAHIDSVSSASELSSKTADELVALYNEANQAGVTSDALYGLLASKANINDYTISTNGDIVNLSALMSALGLTVDETGHLVSAKGDANNATIFTNADIGNLNSLFNTLGYSITQTGNYINIIDDASGHTIKTDGSISNINDLIVAYNRLAQAKANQYQGTGAARADSIDVGRSTANGRKVGSSNYTIKAPSVSTASGGNKSNSSSGGGGHSYNYKPSTASSNSGGSGKNGGGSGGNSGNDGGSGSSSSETEEQFDMMERLLQNQSDYIDKVNNRIQDRYSNSYNSKQYGKLISASKKQVKNLYGAKGVYAEKAALSGLSKKWRKRVEDGSYSVYDIKDENLKKQIQDYEKWYDKAKDCDKQIQELNNKIADYEKAQSQLKLDKLDQTVNYYKAANDELESNIDLLKKRGKAISDKNYKWAISNNNKQIDSLKAENKLYKKLQENLSKTSQEYQDYQDKINSNKNEILSLQSDNEDQKANMRENRWSNFNKKIEQRENLGSELSDIKDKFDNSDNYYDDKGNITDEGKSYIALTALQIQNATEQIEDYRVGIKKLDQDLKNGNITQDEYNETLNDYLSKIRDASKDVDSLKDSLVDMYETQLQAENDLLDKEIEKRKDALKAKQDYYSYNRTLSEKNKDINAIKAQIAALDGTSTAAGKAKKALLEAQLKESQDDLDDTKRSHQMDLMSDGYDKLETDADKVMDDLLDKVKTNSAEQTKVINEMLNNIKTGYKETYSYIMDIVNKSGIKLSSDGSYDIGKLQTSTGTNNVVNGGKGNVDDKYADSAAKNISTSKIDTNYKTGSSSSNKTNTSTTTAKKTCTKIKVSKSSVSVKVGATVSVTATTTPSGCSVTWKTSNKKIATVSGGKIKGVAKGSCTITATSGTKSAKITVTVTAASSKPQVSAIKATLKKGNKSNDVKTLQKGLNALGFTDSNGKKLDVDGSFGSKTQQALKKAQKSFKVTQSGVLDSATKKKFKAKGYYTGTDNVNKSGIYVTNERGEELSLQKLNAGEYTFLNEGSKVFNHAMSENLWKLAQMDLSKMAQVQLPNVEASGGTFITLNYDKFIQVDGNMDSTVIPDLKKLQSNITKEISKTLYQECKKLGMR